jgi:putative ABC transport system permease protein
MPLALREIRRSALRFCLLAGAVGLLVLLLLFFQAVAGSLVTALSGSVAAIEADVLVYDGAAPANPAVSVLPPDAAERVAAVPGVSGVGMVGQAFALAERDGVQEDAVVIGVEEGRPGLPVTLGDGRVPRAEGEALVSTSGFGEAWATGDRAVIVDTDLAVEVVGTAPDATANASATLYVPLATYEALVRSRVGPQAPLPISFLAVTVDEGADPEAVAADIESAVTDVAALTRADAVDALPGIGTIGRSFGILYALLYLVVGVVTGVFFLILTVQKREALVLLRAIGAERRDVVALVLTQVVLVVGVGAAIGTGAAVALLAAARDTFGAALDGPTAATSAAVVLVIGLLASLGAVRRVTAIDPVEATRSGWLG